MTVSLIQPSFAAGELTPSEWGRTDLSKFHIAAATMRNMFVNYRGGASSRPGSKFIGQALQDANGAPPRLIPFQFNINQSCQLEFGDQYMRVIFNGAYVTEATKNITGATQAYPCQLTVPAHGYSNGSWVAVSGVQGMEELNGRTFIVANATANTFTLQDTFGDAVNSLDYDAYTVGGTVARIYTVTAPYAAIDLPYLKFTQSADVMSLTLVNQDTRTEYPPYDLSRLANDNWTFAQPAFTSSISAPASCTVDVSSGSGTFYAYCVTAVDSSSGDESVASPIGTDQGVNIATVAGSVNVRWSTVNGAGFYNVYKAAAQLSNPVPIGSAFGFVGSSFGAEFVDSNIIQDFTQTPPLHVNPFARGSIGGVTVTNGGSGYTQSTVGYTINTVTGSGAVLKPVVVGGAIVSVIVENGGENYAPGDTITFTGGTSGSGATATVVASPSDGTFGGSLGPVTVTNGGSQYTSPIATVPAPGGGGIQATLSPPVVQGGVITAIYVNNPGRLYSSAPAVTITESAPSGANATATLVIGAQSGTYPGVVAYFQQRRAYAATLNQPDTYFLSQPGRFGNFDSAQPPVDSDAITGNPWAQQVNTIQWMLPMPGGLILLTGLDAWQLSGTGGPATPVTPSQQSAQPQESNGSSPIIPPIKVNYNILYVQVLGAIVRELQYNFYNNIYAGADVSVHSSHLFEGFQLQQWAWAKEPYKIIWTVRNDGRMLSFTYLPEQEVRGWSRHDTNGLYKSVSSGTEPPVIAVYTVVKRYIKAKMRWAYYVERFDDRLWRNAEDCWCVDCGLELGLQFPAATLTAGAATGNSVSFEASSNVFDGTSVGVVGQVIRMGAGKATITEFISPTQVLAQITVAITDVLQDNDDNMPVPAEAGEWSIGTPVTTIGNLWHLEGMTVTGLADAAVIQPTVVQNGQITLFAPASKVVVGLGYEAQLQSLYLDVPGEPTVQGKRKKINAVTVRVDRSRGVKVGCNQPNASAQQNQATLPWGEQSVGAMIEIPQAQNLMTSGDALPLYTGDWRIPIDGGWDTQGMVAVEQTYPLPLNLLALVPEIIVGDTNG